MKKLISKIVLAALFLMPFGIALPAFAIVPPPSANWNTTGTYVVDLNFNSTAFPHDMVLAQDSLGNLTGNGGSPAGANTYKWTIVSGSVSGNTINFTSNYTDTPDAVTPLTVMTVTGNINTNGTMSGTWTDNYQGGERTGTWQTTSGTATALGSLSAQDFGVMDVSNVKGYTAGFGLTDSTLSKIQSAVVKLYSQDTLLQTNTSTSQLATLSGTDFSSPFDVFGTFNYAADGFWTNARESEYGQVLVPTKVIATVTLENGKVVSAENDNLTGDIATIFPINASVITNPATFVTQTEATLNGTNGPANASGHSFWASLTPFVTTSPVLPSGVYSTTDLGAINSNATFSAQLSSVVGMPAITQNTTYYFATWSNVGGTWYPGAVMQFTTAINDGETGTTGEIGGTVTGGPGVLHVDSITADPMNVNGTADGNYADGWKYVFHITAPTNEPNLSMKFADWISGANILPTANNMRIFSAQSSNASNEASAVTLTAANLYSTPALIMTGDNDLVTPGRQVNITVEVKIPTGTVNGSYNAGYSVQTLP